MNLILCVDDEKIVLDSLKSQLKQFFKSEYIIETAESGEEALEILEEYEEEEGILPQLVISDMIMPHMKGSELLEQVHSKYPDTLKILLTGQADKQDIISTVSKVELYRYFAKPWDKMDLNMTVKEALLAYTRSAEIEAHRNQLLLLNKSLEKKVEKRTQELSVKNKMVTDSIQYALRIQEGVLPDLDEIRTCFDDFFILYRPLHIVSGDIYFFSKVGDKIITAAIDCTGHGVPGALMSMIAHSQLNRIVNITGITEPSQILRRFHEGVVKSLQQKNNGIEDGMDVAICTYDLKKSVLTFAGAQRPLVYIQDEEINYIRGVSRPIGGMLTEDRKYIDHKIKIDRETKFYLFSDGFVDQYGGPRYEKYKIRNFRELLLDHSAHVMSKQQDLLEEELDNWMGENEQTDDIIVMGFTVPIKKS